MTILILNYVSVINCTSHFDYKLLVVGIALQIDMCFNIRRATYDSVRPKLLVFT